MAIDLTNRVCLITAAGAGIGAGVARGFVKRGAIVVATDLTPPSVEGAAMSLAWDVSDAKRADAVVAEVVKRYGRIDCLCAIAGIYPRQAWDAVTDDDWRKVMAINLDGAWHGARAAGEAMKSRGYGKVVFVSSITVVATQPVLPHYIASKGGIIGLTRALARSMGPQGIRVNCVMPGAIRTEGETKAFPDQAAILKALNEKQCLPGRIDPEHIEPTFAFLCSSESDAITGQNVCVDHGWVHW